MTETWGPLPAKCIRLTDGDTIVFDLDLGFGIHFPGISWAGKTQISCRVYGINAPELSTQAGKDALAFAQTLIKPGDIVRVLSVGWDKYGGRFDGVITLPTGEDFGETMIANGHAVVYK